MADRQMTSSEDILLFIQQKSTVIIRSHKTIDSFCALMIIWLNVLRRYKVQKIHAMTLFDMMLKMEGQYLFRT